MQLWPQSGWVAPTVGETGDVSVVGQGVHAIEEFARCGAVGLTFEAVHAPATGKENNNIHVWWRT